MTTIEDRRAATNRRLAQWRVSWLREVQYFYYAFVQVDGLVLLGPPLRQAPNRGV